MLSFIKQTIRKFQNGEEGIAKEAFKNAQLLYISGQCQLLSQSKVRYDFWVSDDFFDAEASILLEGDEDLVQNISPLKKGKPAEWDKYTVACLMQLAEELDRLQPTQVDAGKKYTREGMIKRVLQERAERAASAEYRIEFADNIYGEHTLYNEQGVKYKVTLRDFDNETGYVDNMDCRTNKLGTTKHIMFAFNALKVNKKLFKKLDKTYPFVEVYLDPLNHYQITWFYPHDLNSETETLIKKYFGASKSIPKEKNKQFLSFLNEAYRYKEILIRPEVSEVVEREYEESMLQEVSKKHEVDYSLVKADLFDYQKEGIEFLAFKKGTILADEMGLGKTMQAIGTALVKKQVFGFKRTLIVCPASLKYQWKSEIEKFSDETATVIEGTPDQRVLQYKETKDYFLILNYETVLRDQQQINKYGVDFIILDEAQRIKNYNTRTSNAIKSLKRKHSLVLTGTPIENKLIDLYSIVAFLDPYFLAPLWEFSYQYCYFDEHQKNKITGYYNLQELNERLKPILLRREKRNVIKQLPKITQRDIFVNMHPMQADYHAGYAQGIAQIVRKKFMTPFDMQKLMLLMANMRMVCDSTFLIDPETEHSPKLLELQYILTEKFDMQKNDRKIIIFSEWTKMNMLIGKMLKKLNIGFAELSGKVPVKHRKKLVEKFETDPQCQVFISTEAGGSGLNLQIADTVINFELPWNPAKKNQRIGRIDRVGQRSSNLTVLNFITRNSIEMRIASGLMLKQNLFEGVLDTDSDTDTVDFSTKGRSQFLQQIEAMVDAFEENVNEETGIEESLAKELAELSVDTEAVKEEERASQAIEAEESEPSSGETLVATKEKVKPSEQVKEMEQVMNQGMAFLSGLFKMSTGKDMGAENAKIEVDENTGEVVMKFKLPNLK